MTLMSIYTVKLKEWSLYSVYPYPLKDIMQVI